jgi:hypothetical protein
MSSYHSSSQREIPILSIVLFGCLVKLFLAIISIDEIYAEAQGLTAASLMRYH